MPIEVRCPNAACGRGYSLSDDLAGRKVKCKQCGQTFVAGDASSASRVDRPTVVPNASGESTIAPMPSPQEPTPPPEPTKPPPRLGRFELRKKLGSGGFGVVYRAFDPQLEREVALKVPRPGTLDNPKALERFLREAKAAARLRHPNIVPVFDAGRDGDQYFIAAAFIAGTSLDDVVAEGPLDPNRAAAITAKLAAALDYAHTEGIIHRDVKPANVMVDDQDRPHLMDFGLARLEATSEKLTRDGAVLGTPAYMSPEQADGKTETIGAASDQYSLGVLLYELLTGEVPFSGPPQVVIVNILTQPPRPPRQIRPGIPKDVETICLKAMAKEPEKRYASCADFAADLDRWQKGEPITARRVGTAERLVRWAKRNPVIAGLTATAVALLITIAVGATYASIRLSTLARSERAESERAKAATDLAETESERAKAAASQAEAARLTAESSDRDKSRLAYIKNMNDIQLLAEKGHFTECATRMLAHSRGAYDITQPGFEWNFIDRLTNTYSSSIYSAPKRDSSPIPMAYDKHNGRICILDKDFLIFALSDGRLLARVLRPAGKTFTRNPNSVRFNENGAAITIASTDTIYRVDLSLKTASDTTRELRWEDVILDLSSAQHSNSSLQRIDLSRTGRLAVVFTEQFQSDTDKWGAVDLYDLDSGKHRCNLGIQYRGWLDTLVLSDDDSAVYFTRLQPNGRRQLLRADLPRIATASALQPSTLLSDIEGDVTLVAATLDTLVLLRRPTTGAERCEVYDLPTAALRVSLPVSRPGKGEGPYFSAPMYESVSRWIFIPGHPAEEAGNMTIVDSVSGEILQVHKCGIVHEPFLPISGGRMFFCQRDTSVAGFSSIGTGPTCRRPFTGPMVLGLGTSGATLMPHPLPAGGVVDCDSRMPFLFGPLSSKTPPFSHSKIVRRTVRWSNDPRSDVPLNGGGHLYGAVSSSGGSSVIVDSPEVQPRCLVYAKGQQRQWTTIGELHGGVTGVDISDAADVFLATNEGWVYRFDASGKECRAERVSAVGPAILRVAEAPGVLWHYQIGSDRPTLLSADTLAPIDNAHAGDHFGLMLGRRSDKDVVFSYSSDEIRVTSAAALRSACIFSWANADFVLSPDGGRAIGVKGIVETETGKHVFTFESLLSQSHSYSGLFCQRNGLAPASEGQVMAVTRGIRPFTIHLTVSGPGKGYGDYAEVVRLDMSPLGEQQRTEQEAESAVLWAKRRGAGSPNEITAMLNGDASLRDRVKTLSVEHMSDILKDYDEWR